MAGSQKYLDLLDQQAEDPITYQVIWHDLDLAWNELTEKVTVDILDEIAAISFKLISQESETSIDDLIEDAKALHVNKNAGYAGADNPDPWANFRLSEAFGISPLDGVLVRMSDKYIRITNLRRNPDNERVGESILDTLFDLAAYALIAICLIREAEDHGYV